MNIKLIYLFTLSVLLLTACKKDDPVDTNPGDCTDDLGTFTILPSSISQVPYGAASSVVFVDTFGIELHFSISKNEDFVVKGFSAIDAYCFTTHQIIYLLKNDSLEIDLKLTLIASPARFSPTQIYVADILNITYQDANPATIAYGVFNKFLDDGGAPINITTNMVFDSIVILGRNFLEVEQTHYDNPHNWLLFNSTEGIVAFQDDLGNKWRFDRFE